MSHQAQRLLGLHAALLLFALRCPLPVPFPPLAAMCVAFGAFVVMMPWWRRRSAAFGAWVLLSCMFVACLSARLHVLARDVSRHALLFSSLFLLLQPLLPHKTAKAAAGLLLAGGLYCVTPVPPNAEPPNTTELLPARLCAYTLGGLWSAWAIYDTNYWHAQEIKDSSELALLAVSDIITATFAACLLHQPPPPAPVKAAEEPLLPPALCA